VSVAINKHVTWIGAHSLPSTANVKNEWSHTSTPLHGVNFYICKRKALNFTYLYKITFYFAEKRNFKPKIHFLITQIFFEYKTFPFFFVMKKSRNIWKDESLSNNTQKDSK
jgi:hypothetical protein